MWNCMRLVALLTLLAIMPSAAAHAEDNGMTARGIFATLPVSIFENTAEGLSEADKQRLLTEGHTEFWEIAGETEDVMVFAALPFRDSAVALRLFRTTADGSTEAACGTAGGPIAPVEQGRQLPRDINPTVVICLGLGGLKAEPVFWNSSGMTQVPLAHDVSFQWNGRNFEKQVHPHRAQTGEQP